MQVLEVRAVPLAAQAGIALGRLDLDDVGAPVGELAHAVGPARTRVRSITLKRARGPVVMVAVPVLWRLMYWAF